MPLLGNKLELIAMKRLYRQHSHIHRWLKGQKRHTGYGITFSEDITEEVPELIHSHNYIFKAEAMAIKRAGEMIRFKNLSNLNVEVYTDSQAVTKSLQQIVTKNYEIISDCHNIFNKIGENNKIQ